MARRLSKTDFVTGHRCVRALWYRVREPHRADPPGPDRERLLRAGDDVDLYAQSVYAGGVAIEARDLDEAAEQTARAVSDGARRLYQGTWLTDWGGFRADVVDVDGDGLVIREVKASLQPRPHHTVDVAFQGAVAEAAGLAVEGLAVVHLDAHARGPDPPLVERDVTDDARERMPGIRGLAGRLASALDGPAPDAPRGSRCLRPHRCPFLRACWGPLPSPSVLDVPGLSDARLDREVARGARAAADVRRHALTRPARRFLAAVDEGPQFDDRVLRAWTASLVTPVAALVMDGRRPPLPEVPGHRPYDLVPTTAGVAVQGRVATGWTDDDPRRLGAWLSAALDGSGSVVVFGHDVALRALRCLDPPLDRRAVVVRLTDVEPVLDRAVAHPDVGRDRSLVAYVHALTGVAVGPATAGGSLERARSTAAGLLDLVARLHAPGAPRA